MSKIEKTVEPVEGLVSNEEVTKLEGKDIPEDIRKTIAQILETYHGKFIYTSSAIGVTMIFVGLMIIVGSLLAVSDHKAIALVMCIAGILSIIFGALHKRGTTSADFVRDGDFIYFISTVNQVKTPTPSTKIFYTVEDIRTYPLLDSDSDGLREGSTVLCIYTGKGVLCTDTEFHNIKEYAKVNVREEVHNKSSDNTVEDTDINKEEKTEEL